MFFYLFAENFIFGEFPEKFYTYSAGLTAVEVSRIAGRYRLYLLCNPSIFVC